MVKEIRHYKMEKTTYEKMAQIGSRFKLKTLKLNIIDSDLNAAKLQDITQFVLDAKPHEFELSNLADSGENSLEW
jgi:hypothetical protein